MFYIKKNIKNLILTISLVGVVCTACTTNNKNVPEIEVTVEETETVETDEMVETDTEWIIPEETEVVEPEVIEEETIEAIDIVENTEEKPEGKKLNVHDAQNCKSFCKEY